MMRHISPGNTMKVAGQSMDIWHQRLGHTRIQEMADNNLVEGLSICSLSVNRQSFCKGCVFGSMTRRSHPRKDQLRNCLPGEFIHCDISGKMSQASLAGNRYYICFKDEASGFSRVMVMKTKDQALDYLKKFHAEVRKQTGNDIKLLRSDCGTKFLNKSFDKYLTENRIVRETSPSRTPVCNGLIERENRTLVEKARSMLHQKGLPVRLWAEAVSTAAYVLNYIPNNRSKNKTPYGLWYGHKSSVGLLRVFGCPVYVHVNKSERQKWDSKAREMIMV